MTPETIILKGASALVDASYYDELDDLKRSHLRDMAWKTRVALDKLTAERKAVDAEMERLRAALKSCIEEYSYAAEYKGEFLREKHGDDEQLAISLERAAKERETP